LEEMEAVPEGFEDELEPDPLPGTIEVTIVALLPLPAEIVATEEATGAAVVTLMTDETTPFPPPMEGDRPPLTPVGMVTETEAEPDAEPDLYEDPEAWAEAWAEADEDGAVLDGGAIFAQLRS
jgi:hypothetical protein